MRAYSQEGEGAVFGWGDDFDGEDGGEDADDAEAEDVEFEDFAASLTPEETCERISKLAASHIAGVLGFELPPDLGERAFDPAAIARSPQPLPAALEFTLAAGADSAVLASCPTDRADARGHLSAPRDLSAALGEDPEAPSTSLALAAFRVPSAPERSARVRLHDPRRPSAYPRLWSLLRTVHAHCSEGRTVTNRGLYYLLATADHALWGPGAHAAVARALGECVRLLRCSRRAMGITTAGRGLAAGRLEVREFGTAATDDGLWRDFSGIHAPPYEIPGDIDAVEATSASGGVRVAASYALVVEKDAVFDRLRRERIWERVPLVLVTAKGFPDLATRAFLRGIQNRFPSVATLGLVDWNPSGALILRAYRSGSARAALESARYALEVKWLGVRLADITNGVRDGAATMPLTSLDRAKIRNLLETADARTEAGRATRSELSEMARLDRKAEIESLCPLEHGGGGGGASLSEYVVGKIVRGEYV